METFSDQTSMNTQRSDETVIIELDADPATVSVVAAPAPDSRGHKAKGICIGAAALVMAGCLLLAGTAQHGALHADFLARRSDGWGHQKARRSSGWGQIGSSWKHECMPGIVGRKQSDGNSCVFMAKDCHFDPANSCDYSVDTWEIAESRCQSVGGHLVSITSQAENENAHNVYIEAHGGEDYSGAWLGFTDYGNLISGASEGEWRWAEGSGTYTAWAPGEPNSWEGEQDCAAMMDDSKWDDRRCGERLHYMCSVPMMTLVVRTKWHGNEGDSVEIYQQATVQDLIDKFSREYQVPGGPPYTTDGLRLIQDEIYAGWNSETSSDALLEPHRTLWSYGYRDGFHLLAIKVQSRYGGYWVTYCVWGDYYCY